MTSDTAIDTQRAEEDPAAVFAAPQDVVQHGGLSRGQKLRILRRWKLDALELEVATEEDMTGGEASRLDEVITALKAVGDDSGTPGTGVTKHGF